jgi:hypothetical protein
VAGEPRHGAHPRRPPPSADQGKIERWHQTLKNRILLEHHYLPGALEEQVAAFVEHYNHARAHESLSNLTPADVYFGRGEAISPSGKRIKRQTLARRRLQHHAQPPNLKPRWTRPSASRNTSAVSNRLTTDS